MGKGYGYKCKKCGHEYTALPGVGRMYPVISRNILAEIADGVYGEEWKDLVQNTPYAAINASTFIYICNHCRRWEQGTDLTLYEPDDPDQVANTLFWGKTDMDCIGVLPLGLRTEYHVLKRRYHMCEKCGRRMHKASAEEEQNLPCPKCGEPNKAEGTIMWD